MWYIALIVGAVVLATGNSENVQKYLLQVDGKTVIEGVFDSLEEVGVTERVIVLGGDIDEVAEAIRPKLGKIKIALNLTPELGVVSSFQTGLIVIQNVDAAFLILGDEPIFDSTKLAEMIKVIEKTEQALIVSTVRDMKKSYLLLFRKALFSEILSLSAEQNLFDFLKAYDDKLATIEVAP